jgi:glycosyltransferase involved in cell wall biosynthesis
MPSSDTVTCRESVGLPLSSALGEAFGDVIAEGLWVGRPVFVTATTPWTELFLSGKDKNNYLR